MSDAVLELTDSTFDEAVANGVALVDLWAPWCGPCKMQGPIIEKVAEAVGEKATVAKLNVDEASAVAAKYGVMSIPTLILFQDGEETKRFVGLQQQEALVAAIEELL